jgi:hypothetical protein
MQGFSPRFYKPRYGINNGDLKNKSRRAETPTEAPLSR